MKQIVKMSRLTNELEKLFKLLNEELFNNALPTPIITVIPTPRAYAHYVPFDIWNTSKDQKREINIASGTLNRPLEEITASMVHEMVHMFNDIILNISDCSNKGVYHNAQFKRQAELHGLIVTHTRYGWSHTEPGERILDFVIEHDELNEIEMCRANPAAAISTGTHTGDRNTATPATPTTNNSHHRKYICPICGNSVRATKAVNIMCLDCNAQMVQA